MPNLPTAIGPSPAVTASNTIRKSIDLLKTDWEALEKVASELDASHPSWRQMVRKIAKGEVHLWLAPDGAPPMSEDLKERWREFDKSLQPGPTETQ